MKFSKSKNKDADAKHDFSKKIILFPKQTQFEFFYAFAWMAHIKSAFNKALNRINL